MFFTQLSSSSFAMEFDELHGAVSSIHIKNHATIAEKYFDEFAYRDYGNEDEYVKTHYQLKEKQFLNELEKIGKYAELEHQKESLGVHTLEDGIGGKIKVAKDCIACKSAHKDIFKRNYYNVKILANKNEKLIKEYFNGNFK